LSARGITQNSLDRPWILYEAGVAKGKLETPVHGVALGVPLSKASSGPFAQFQNCDGSDAESVSKLVIQLAKRLPNADPQKNIVDSQVAEFTKKTAELLKATATTLPQPAPKKPDDSSTAKLFEEIKVMFQDLPSRMEDRISNAVRPPRRRKWRHFHPKMLHEMMNASGLKEGDPIEILLMASLVREEMPWFYEMAREIYSTLKTGDAEIAEHELRRLGHMVEMMMHGPFMEDFGDEESQMIMMEFPRMFDHILHRYMGRARKSVPRKRLKPDTES